MRVGSSLLALAVCVLLNGCAEQKSGDTHSDHDGHDHSSHSKAEAKGTPSPEFAKIVRTEGAPDRMTGVMMARKDAKHGELVTVVGRVKDFVKGQGIFTMVDPILPACNDHPDDKCETPWDYCCEPKDKLLLHTATVKLIGEDNQIVKGTLQGTYGLDHLTTVVARGKAERDDTGNFLIAATEIYIKKVP